MRPLAQTAIKTLDKLLATKEAELAVAGQPAGVAGDHVASGQERAAIVAE